MFRIVVLTILIITNNTKNKSTNDIFLFVKPILLLFSFHSRQIMMLQLSINNDTTLYSMQHQLKSRTELSLYSTFFLLSDFIKMQSIKLSNLVKPSEKPNF